MNDLSKVWHWLLDENNRGGLKLVSGALAALAVAWWALFKYRRGNKDAPVPTDTGLNADQIRAIIDPLLVANKDQATQITQLSHQLGISEGAVGAFFDALGREQVPPERRANALAQVAQQHLSVLKRLESLPADDATIEIKTRAAREAVEAGDHQRADELLAECVQLDLDAAEAATKDAKTHQRRAAERSAARGELAMTRIDYPAAAEHFRRAAELAGGLDAELQNRFLHERASVLGTQGDEKGDNAALTEAIDAWRGLLERQPRERVPLDWAATQNNLGQRAVGSWRA